MDKRQSWGLNPKPGHFLWTFLGCIPYVGLGHGTRNQVKEDAKKTGTQENGSPQMPLRRPHHGPPSVLALTETVAPGVTSVSQCLVSGLIFRVSNIPQLTPN